LLTTPRKVLKSVCGLERCLPVVLVDAGLVEPLAMLKRNRIFPPGCKKIPRVFL